MSPTDATRRATGPTAAPRRIFLSHTAVLRARHAVTDMAYFAARDPAQHRLVGTGEGLDGIGGMGTGGITATTPLRVFLSHTHDLRRHPADRSASGF